MTRVLFLTESFHPVLGGGETHIRALGAALVKSGLPALVVTRRAELSWPAEEIVDGIRVVRVPPPGPALRAKYRMVPAAWRAVRRRRAEYDVLVVRGTRVLGLPGLLAARADGRRVVLQPEVNGELTGEVYTWGKPWAGKAAGRLVRKAAAVTSRALRDADAFVAMSRPIADEMRQAGVAEERIHLIPHGIDTGHFRPPTSAERSFARAALGLDEDTFAVVYTGRLLRGKGLEDLVEAFARLRAAVAGRLFLVGSGGGQALSVEDALRQRVVSAGLESHVTFAGRRDDVRPFLWAADAFAFPSVFEALGLSLIEASSCGLPVVAARAGGIVDVVEDGRSGSLIAPGDAEALTSRLLALAGDPAMRRRMGEGGRRTALSRFDAQQALERYRGLFAELTRRDGGSCVSR